MELYQVSTAYEECLVPIDMYLYTAPPGPPTGVTAVRSGPTSVSVSWTAPTSGGPVSRYDIYYVANGVPSTKLSGVGTVQKVGGLKLIIHKWVW